MADHGRPTGAVPGFEVPGEMREFAGRSVEQARRAFDTFMNAAQAATTNMQASTGTLHGSAREATQQAAGFAEQNVRAAFDLAQQLVAARGLDDVMRIQTEFMQSQMTALQKQMTTLQEQMKTYGEVVTKATTGAPDKR